MTLTAAAVPLVAFAAGFQTVVFLLVPSRLRSTWAPLAIGMVGAFLTVAATALFGPARMGLAGGEPGLALAAGGATAALVSLLAIPVLRSPSLRHHLYDQRVARWNSRSTALHIGLRIPVMTALIEEAFFRGLLHAALVATVGPAAAIVLGAGLFGLWHIGPALEQSESDDRDVGMASRILLTVVATSLAGAGLVWLRVETGSIWVPFAVHAALNMTMAVFARLVSRPAHVPDSPFANLPDTIGRSGA